MDFVATVLGAIYPDGKDAFIWARDHLPSKYFDADAHTQKMWDFTSHFLDSKGTMPTVTVMESFFEHVYDAGTAAYMLQKYKAYCALVIEWAEFQYAVEMLVDAAQKNRTGEIIATAYEILEQGYVVDGEKLEGHEKAREFLSRKVSELDKDLIQASVPEGDVLSEADQILADYKKAKENSSDGIIPTYFPSLDSTIGGFRKGDLVLIASFTGSGKSQMCVNWSYTASIVNGSNVFYATTETTRIQIRSRFLARHSRQSQFNCDGGLDHSMITRGALNEKHEKVLENVLEDLSTNPAYGKFHIAQLPSHPTLSYIEQRMLREQQSWNIDMLTIDSLNLLRPEVKRTSQREELVNILTSAQSLSSSYNGKGVVLLSPWQINRDGYEKAKTSRTYELTGLAESSEAEKSADIIFSLFYDAEESTREATLQTLKTRGTATPKPITLEVDYRNSFLTESKNGGKSSAMQSSAPSSLSGLIS